MNGLIASQLDPWFEEGFAEYFSSIEVDSKEARVGKIPPNTYQIVQQQGLMKVADLLRVQQASATYNESGDRRSVFYAESSMLVHYLYDNQLIPKLAIYFGLKIDQGVPVEDAIQQSFGMSAAQFDKTLRNYVSSNRYMYYPMKTPADIVNKGYTTKPLSAGDGAAVIADIHLHSPDHRDVAMAEFGEIIKQEPNNAAALRGLGYSYLQKHDYEHAGEYFKRAALADPKDARVHYYSALLMSRQGSFDDRSALPEVTKELETAIALDPSLADAYSLQAFALAHAGSPGKGIAAMQKAVSLNPRNIGYRFNLAQMYLGNQQTDQAIAIFRALLKSSDEGIARRAQEALTQAEEYKAALRSAASQALIARSSPVDPANSLHESSRTAAAPDIVTMPEGAPVKFLKGTIVSVDCSAAPAATATVLAGTKTWKMRIRDSNHVLLLGADAFSCAWTKQKVAMNYRETGDAAGIVVSIEIR
jgi:tetratricopeptide (TPR) repeat protein